MAKDKWKHYDTIVRLPEYQATLYTKHESLKKVWQCRMKPRRGPAIIKSTKTTSLASATEYAKRWYEATSTAEDAGLSPRQDPSFVAVWAHFRRAHRDEGKITAARMKTITGIVEKYYCQYFGSMNIRTINSGQYENYKSWRLTYWTHGQGVEELMKRPKMRHAKVPAPATLRYEHACFMQIMHWAHKTGYLARPCMVDAYKTAKGIQKTRGGGPSQQQWARITAKLWQRAFAPKTRTGEPKELSATHKHERAVLYYIVVFMGGTMMRPSEAMRIRWRHLVWRPSDLKEGVEDLLVNVSASVSKTKEKRIAVGTNRCAEYMRQWKAATQYGNPDDFVFPRYGGQQLGSPNKTFTKVLKEVNATHDHEDLKITLYSCRHYGITAALKRDIPILEVALLAGTSVHHIEKRYWRADVVKRASYHALQDYFDPEEIR
jgi:integrase